MTRRTHIQLVTLVFVGVTLFGLVTRIDAGQRIYPGNTKEAADPTIVKEAELTTTDFNVSVGVVSIDYTNGQAASSSVNGFLSSSDWIIFNGKLGTETDPTLTNDATVSIGDNTSGDTTLTFDGDGNVDGTIVWDVSDDQMDFSSTLDLQGDVLDSTGNLTLNDSVDITGALSVAGAITYTGSGRPKRTIVLTGSGAIVPAGGATQPLTNGTNFNFYTVDYADGSIQDAYWQFIVPDSFDSSVTTVDVTVMWMTGVTTGNVVWEFATDGKPVNGATLFDSALQTAQTEQFAVNGTANAVASSTFSTPPTSGWAPGEIVIVKLSRKGSDTSTGGTGDDVSNGTKAQLISLKIEWTANSESD